GAWDVDLIPPLAQKLPRWSVDGVMVQANVDLGVLSLPAAVPVLVRVVGPGGEAATGVTVRVFAVDMPLPCSMDGGCVPRARLRAESDTSDFGELSVVLAAP